MHIDKDLVAASATPLVLAILAEDESYGYAILKRVRELSGGELEWTDGMLYPLLHRLRRLGYVTTEWRTPPQGVAASTTRSPTTGEQRWQSSNGSG
jgi:PadR family transcriptional regulator, regulatory protein PadR